ncbi:MAG: hypothetical protein IJ244_06555 [Bacteroidaceae bacterium]|nr:hypothetical protein [Bacteroidaceae bacterium]
MTERKNKSISGRGVIGASLLLFFFLFVCARPAISQVRKQARPDAQKIILKYADKVKYDEARNPNMQIFVGNVVFSHNGLLLYCDSANFNQESNSFWAFGNVKMNQGDTLTLNSRYMFYDGNIQVAYASRDVVLKNRNSVLYTDSLMYDREYQLGYFVEGGKLIDAGDTLTSDWGRYNTANKVASFYYNVQLNNKEMRLTSDSLHYDTQTKVAHMLGKSNVFSGDSRIYTRNGYYNTQTKYAILLDSTRVVDNNQRLEADSIIYDQEKGISQAFKNIVYNDRVNKNILTGNYCYHNDSTGYTIAYDSAVVRNFSQGDTLHIHADTFKIYSYNLNTDSVYRVIHGYYHSRSFKNDIQSVADSLSYNSETCILSLWGNPIIWNESRQILGEEIYAFMNDSTVDSIRVVNQALMVEQLDSAHYNQITGKEMRFFFENGKLKENRVIGNVQTVYYAYDDSLMVGMNCMETSLARMFMAEKKLSKIWTKEAKGTYYALALASRDKAFLDNFVWFDYIRPLSKDDIFVWRAKSEGTEIKKTVRRTVPYQYLDKLKKK